MHLHYITVHVLQCHGVCMKDFSVSLHSLQVYCPAFFVAYDHQEEAVVVTIRGTITVKVCITYTM